jgi:hypothetical protein
VYEILSETQVFQALRNYYLQFRLKKVMFAATPRVVDGTDPAPVWIYLDTAANNMIHYASLQELQGSRPLPVKHFSITSFSSSGRQDDFNYWYDTQQYPQMNVSIRLHSEATPTLVKFWQFQLGYQIEFRGLVIQTINNKISVKQISETPPKQESGSTQEEDKKQEFLKNYEDVDWNQEVSDDENVD